MAEARGRAAWDQTATLLAQQANLHRGKGDRPRKPSEFNPYTVAAVEEDDVVRVKLSELRGMFSNSETIPATDTKGGES